jgi:hypothetical protein
MNEKFDEISDLEYIKYYTSPIKYLKDIDKEMYNKLKNIDNNTNFINRSIPIAAMITAYASIFMIDFINLNENSTLYTDTDSLFRTTPLPNNLVGKELGQFDFKGKVLRGYFLAPKFYCLVMENGDIITKTKGLSKNTLTEQDFLELYFGLTKKIPIEKFISKLYKSNISLRYSYLNIKPQILKREPIYKDGLIIDTAPLKVINGKLIKLDIKNNFNFNIVPYSPKN